MSDRIWKYELPSVPGSIWIEMPFGAKILTVQTQYNKPYLWVAVFPTVVPRKNRHFLLLETGNDKIPIDSKYIGTVQLDEGSYVLHVYEVP